MPITPSVYGPVIGVKSIPTTTAPVAITSLMLSIMDAFKVSELMCLPNFLKISAQAILTTIVEAIMIIATVSYFSVVCSPVSLSIELVSISKPKNATIIDMNKLHKYSILA